MAKELGSEPTGQEFRSKMEGAIENSSTLLDGLRAMRDIYLEEGRDVPEPLLRALQDTEDGTNSTEQPISQDQIEEDLTEILDGDVESETEETSAKQPIVQTNEQGVESRNIKIKSKSKMKRIPAEKLAELNLDKLGDSESQVLHPAHDESTNTDMFILQRPNGAFELDNDHPLIQEAQLEVASTMINAVQSRSPIDRAAAIQSALKQHGFKFSGGPFELLRFAVQAMDIVIEFEKRQTQMRMMDIHQSGLLQLQEDMGANAFMFNLLPAHRKMNVALLSQVFMIRDAEEIMTDKTLTRSEDMMQMNKNLEAMKKETRSMWMETAQEAASRLVNTTTGAAKQVITDLGMGITEVSGDAIQKLQTILLGQDSVDEGTVNSLLDSMGSLGTKLREGFKKSGIDAVDFFKNMGSKKGSDPDDVEGE